MISQIKLRFKQLVFQLAIALNRYQPFTQAERECVQGKAIPFVGDLPASAGTEYNQYQVNYKLPRPFKEEITDLLYTPRGMAWYRGKLYERLSLQEPAVRDLLAAPSKKTAIEIPEGTVVQVETPYSYGDWVSEHLIALAKALPLQSPLLMPVHLMNKSYVRRDLAKLGIEAIAVEQPMLIRNATVLHKTRHSHYFKPDEIEAYRRAFHIAAVQPRPGSILYLSRLGQATSEGFNRSYPSELCEEVLREFGAKVVRVKDAGYDDYIALTSEAETVVADFGSALLNIMLWNTKNVIVLFTDEWWDGAALFIADGLGISNVAQVRVNNISAQDLHTKLAYYLNLFDVPFELKSSV